MARKASSKKGSRASTAGRQKKRTKPTPETVTPPPFEAPPEWSGEHGIDVSPTVYRVGKPRGRPLTYRPELCEKAATAAINGATDEEIAEELGIDGATFYRWRARFPEFKAACKWGKDNCDERVERSLYARAVGYTYETVKIMQFEGKPVIVAHKEHIAPDISAAKMWLTNRRRKDWADRQQHEHGAVGDFDQMSDDELDAHIEAEAKALAELRKSGKGPKATKH